MIPKYLISVIGSAKMKTHRTKEDKRIESKFEVKTYLDRLKYAIKSDNVKLNFIKDRDIDKKRDKKYTNRYTMSRLFPNEDETEVLKRELSFLRIDEYIETVKDKDFPKRSDMRVFGRKYSGEDVYIKIRVELVSVNHASGDNFILVMSFHYSDRVFKKDDFPYIKG